MKNLDSKIENQTHQARVCVRSDQEQLGTEQTPASPFRVDANRACVVPTQGLDAGSEEIQEE